jgi:hypothetical protein
LLQSHLPEVVAVEVIMDNLDSIVMPTLVVLAAEQV